MAFRKYIIRNGAEAAWMTHIYSDGGAKVYRYLPDVGMAMTFDTLHEARRIAAACRGRVQVLRMSRSGEPYGEDVDK